jgi:hypothetical protein
MNGRNITGIAARNLQGHTVWAGEFRTTVGEGRLADFVFAMPEGCNIIMVDDQGNEANIPAWRVYMDKM